MISINGKTRLCGLIGNPVEHTLSPIIHNTLASIYDHNLVYVPFFVEKGQVDTAVKGAYALNVLGLNVTVPYKTDVIASLSDIDPLAKKIGAVNTLVRTKEGYKGYNTDVLGLKRAFEISHLEIKDRNVVVLGAGGASRAVLYLCDDLGAKKVYLLNRSKQKALALADEVNNVVGKTLVNVLEYSEYEKIEENNLVAIQATSVGLSPNDNEVVIDADGFYDKISYGYDLIYRPEETRFMKLVKAHGGVAYNGLSMLAYQGVIAYELWNDVKVDEKDSLKILELITEAIK